ncbi:replicase-associated polyprotein [Olive latent virus 3]|uniref:Replicase-associated polyprotein n=1 Tax=Olive latent virus 3 TaxID=626962 RepID=C5HGJ1_9VIRU|nr:replicase-associated polyprotein [Olive latent virus 3]ACN94861.2 replicase-associated polyprotein [Olive latent virus 3]
MAASWTSFSSLLSNPLSLAQRILTPPHNPSIPSLPKSGFRSVTSLSDPSDALTRAQMFSPTKAILSPAASPTPASQPDPPAEPCSDPPTETTVPSSKRALLDSHSPSPVIPVDETAPISPPIRLTGSGLKDLVDFLNPTVHRDTIAAPLLETISQPLRDSLRTYPWSVPPSLQTHLQSLGINAHNFGYKPHPHPAHKVIETHLLHEHWRHLATQPSAILFMKPSKFQKLHNQNDNFTELHNYRLTSKDSTRYPETSRSIPNLPSIFLHDALMYFTPSQILDLFERSPALEKCFASLVCPPESNFTDISFYPELYRFRAVGDSITYELEGNPASSYTQPKSAIEWLKITTIKGPNFSLSITILESWGPCHSLLIQRGLLPLHQEHSTQAFKTPEAILLPAPSHLQQDLRHRLVPTRVYESIFVYVRAVRTLRVTDPSGYVRTQSSKPEYSWVTTAAWDNLANFALLTCAHRPRARYYLYWSTLDRLMGWIRAHKLALLTASTPLASLGLASSALLACRPFWMRLDSLQLLNRWVIKPSFPRNLPFLLPKAFQPKASLFKAEFLPRHAPSRILPEFFDALLKKAPFLRPLFSDAPIPSWAWALCATGVAIPIIALSIRRFLGPNSPQALLDEYQSYFHPKPWQLILEQGPIFANPEPFSPHCQPIPSSGPDSAPSSTLGTPPMYPSSPPAPVEEKTILVPTVRALPPAPPPSSVPPPSKPSPAAPAPVTPPSLPTPVIPPLSTPTPETRVPEVGKSGIVASDLPPTEISPNPTLARCRPNFLGLCAPHPNSNPSHPEPSAPSPLITDPSGSLTAINPTLEPFEFNHALLGADPSGQGPVAQFNELFPSTLWLQGTGEFLTRSRVQAPSSAPYPAMDCLLHAIHTATRIPKPTLWAGLCSNLPDSFLDPQLIAKHGLSTDHFAVLARLFSLRCTFQSRSGTQTMGVADATHTFRIRHTPPTEDAPGHFEYMEEIPESLTGAFAQDLAHFALSFRFNGYLLPFKHVHTYTSNVSRAKNLISNMKNGFDGVMASADPLHPGQTRERFLSMDNQLDIAVPRETRLIHISGFAGCGKTYPITQLLKKPVFRQFRVAVPTTELRSEWKDLLTLEPADRWRIGTWESSLLKSSRVLVIDEVYKMPRGYLDLRPTPLIRPIQFVIIPWRSPSQGEYNSTHPHSSNLRITSEIIHLQPYIDFYCFWSYRIPKNVAACLKVPTTSNKTGFIRRLNSIPNANKVLTCSQSSMKTLNQCGFSSVTIASSQGSTLQEAACIHLDRNSRNLSNSHSLVAITRSKSGIIFTGDFHLLDGTTSSNYLFSCLAQGKSVDLEMLFPKTFPPCPRLLQPIRSRRTILVGSSEDWAQFYRPTPLEDFSRFQATPVPETAIPCPNGYQGSPEMIEGPSHANLPFEADLDSIDPLEGETSPYSLGFGVHARTARTTNPEATGDIITQSEIVLGDGELNMPQVSTHFLPETRRPLHFDNPSALPSSTVPSPVDLSRTAFEPVYPGETFENIAGHFMGPRDPEVLEIIHNDQMSNQFPLLDQPFSLAAQPSSLMAAIHNSQNDPTLLPASIGKRLRFRPSNAPYPITAEDQILGSLLFEALCRAYRRHPEAVVPFNPIAFAECINLNEYAQLTSKTQAVIISNARRSDPDWRYSAVRIFSKTQHKVNDGSFFGSWKACQTLALMHDAVILLLGPVKKYQRLFDSEDRPSHIYIHAGHTPQDMSNWCQQNLTDSIHLTNDYTSFDQSQHGEAVVLEQMKMARLSIPQHLIDLHTHLKCNVSTQFGPLTCMRLTGEPGTYDDNSDYNLAVIHLQYAVGSTPCMVSGDDSLLDSKPPIRDEWTGIAPLLALRFKTELDRYSLFCGYFVGSSGAVRCPRALFAKIMIAVDDGSIPLKIASYLTEFSIGHSLGDEFWQLLPVEQVVFQSACFDFFCRNCPPAAKLLLRLGEAPQSILEATFGKLKWASNAVYSMLSATARHLLIKSRLTRPPPESVEVSQLQGQLLASFQH